MRVITSLNPENGGVTEAVNQSLLSSFDLDISVVCFDEPDDSWILELKRRGANVQALGRGRTSYQIHFGYLKWMIKNHKKYDLFYFDGVWQFHVVPALLFKLLDVKYVVQPHGMLSHEVKSVNMRYIKKLISWMLVERFITKNASKIVFTAEEEEVSAIQSYPFPVFSSAIIPLGITGYSDLKMSTSTEFVDTIIPKLGSDKYILFLSRIDKIKGIELFIDSVLKNNVFDENYVYLIVGPDSTDLGSKLRKKIDVAGKTKYFAWHGMVSGSLKWDIISNANAFILPSYHENFGIVVAEAMSASIPVLISDKVNINETVLRYGGGVVFENTEISITDALFSWFNGSTDFQIEMGRCGRSCFHAEFNNERMMKSFEILFFDIISKKSFCDE